MTLQAFNGVTSQLVDSDGLGGHYRVSRNAPNFNDVLGRTKVSRHQNIYDADFEYGKQPLRWEEFTAGAGTIAHQPGAGSVRMRVTTVAGDITIRQSRPYHRYQPGKTMFMATAVNFGTAQTNQVQRVGFFDDSNGVFFEQASPTAENPSGMACVVRSDASGTVTDTRFRMIAPGPVSEWSGDPIVRASLDWTRIQMVFVEYAWYGAGAVRWGIFINGEPIVLHQVGFGNRAAQTVAWSRTGNLPVRYEQRNIGAVAAQNDMSHYGVSVLVEGGVDDQRGFTYSYGMAAGTPRRTVAANATRYPVLSIRSRVMGISEYTQATAAATAGTTTSLTAGTAAWTVNQWQGRGLSYVVAGVTYTARITSNTATVLTLADVVTGGALAVAPVAGQNYAIGLINRGQILPRKLYISASSLARIELIASTPTSPVVLTGSNFVALSSLGSANSFAERDVSGTSLSGGEVVFAFTAPAGGSGLQEIDLSNFFPLLNTIRGDRPDILTLAVSTPGTAADVGADFYCQEAMS
jgi:hypothetical protein